MDTVAELFEDYAAFYAERYVPFLVEEGFIDDPEDSEFAEGLDGFEPLPDVDTSALPSSYAELLSQVGHGSLLFPTEQGPARFGVLDVDAIDAWKSTLVSFLGKAESAPASDQATPFLVDDGGGILAFFVSKEDERIFVATHEGSLRGPVDSLQTFFATLFDNAKQHRLPFDGM